MREHGDVTDGFAARPMRSSAPTEPPLQLASTPLTIRLRGQMQPIRIGSFEIDRIADFEGPAFEPAEFFPDFDPEVVRANAELLGPRLIDPASGKLMFSFHSFVVRTGHHNILIDACIGND